MNGRSLIALSVTIFAAGCQPPAPEGFARFVPAPEIARQALSTALEGWREGKAAGLIETVSPHVYLIDKRLRDGRKLDSFEILGEFPADNARGFAARLKFAGEGPDEPALARYLVLGIDPLWIYRQEDLEMFLHWMHAMDEPKGDEISKGSP